MEGHYEWLQIYESVGSVYTATVTVECSRPALVEGFCAGPVTAGH